MNATTMTNEKITSNSTKEKVSFVMNEMLFIIKSGVAVSALVLLVASAWI